MQGACNTSIIAVMKMEESIFRKRQAKEGKKGGNETLKRHGKGHFSKIAKAMWRKRKAKVDNSN